MTTDDPNLYAAPQAEVSDEPLATGGYYVVSSRKFWLLFLGTLGIYQLYWFYRHWSYYRARSGESVWPVARAIFAIFFTHDLFRHFYADAQAKGNSHEWKPNSTATQFVILSILENVFSKLSGWDKGVPLTSILSLVALGLVGVTLARAQFVANLASGDAKGASNARLSGLNYLWLVLGGVIWLFALIGIFFELAH